MKVAFGTVAYREAAKYFDDFVKSINLQSNRDFSVLIVSEGLDKVGEDEFRKKIDRDVAIIHVGSDALPHKNRIQLIAAAKSKGIDLLVLGDIDDIADPDRVARIVRGFDDRFAFFYNDIVSLDGKRIFPELPKTSKRFDLVDKNYMGLSNTALNMRWITPGFLESLENGATSYFDWYFFSRMLDEVGDAKYIGNAVTNYRIHENNIAGSPATLDAKKEIQVKLEHYRLMALTDSFYERYAILCESLVGAEPPKPSACRTSEERKFWWQNVNCTQLLKERESDHV